MKTYNVDESRKKDDDGGEDTNQGAVQSRLNYSLRECLQRHWEDLEDRRIPTINIQF